MKRGPILVGVALLGACLALRAQESPRRAPTAPATAKHAGDEKAIAAVVSEFARAFDAGDARAAAATFAEDALVIDEDGERIEGREAIRNQLAAAFADRPGARIEIKTESLRFLGPDTALEEGRTAITPRGGEAPEKSRFTAIYIRRDGRWLQSAIRDESVGELSAHERLRDLEWMVGDWINESQENIVNTTCKWAGDGNFLVREFDMKIRGERVLAGNQRIGWDPLRKQFRTWIFDSQGGFGEGYWTGGGDQWVIKLEGVRPDGQPASATSILTRLGKDRVRWQVVDRTLGAVALPDSDEFILVRKPPDVGK